MVDKWVFFVAFFELLASSLILAYVAKLQIDAFKTNSSMQPLKKILLSLVVVLIVAHIPLMVVYANTLWGTFHSIWIVYVAVLANSTSTIVGAYLLYTVYKFQSKD